MRQERKSVAKNVMQCTERDMWREREMGKLKNVWGIEKGKQKDRERVQREEEGLKQKSSSYVDVDLV